MTALRSSSTIPQPPGRPRARPEGHFQPGTSGPTPSQPPSLKSLHRSDFPFGTGRSPSRGRCRSVVKARSCPTSGEKPPPLMGEVGGGGATPTNLSILSPPQKPRAYSSPSPRTGGLQANRGGVSRVGALPLPQVRVRTEACARPGPYCSKNRHPETAFVSYLYCSEALAVSGSARLLLGMRLVDNRSTGGALARPYPCKTACFRPNPTLAAILLS